MLSGFQCPLIRFHGTQSFWTITQILLLLKRYIQEKKVIIKILQSKNYLIFTPFFFLKSLIIRKDADFKEIKWNIVPKRSHHGPYPLQYEKQLSVNLPLNPVGRTGLIGRGHLGKWGPNHAAG